MLKGFQKFYSFPVMHRDTSVQSPRYGKVWNIMGKFGCLCAIFTLFRGNVVTVISMLARKG